MENLSDIAFILACIFGAITVVGLINPFIVVWWSQNKSRLKAFAVYGTITAIFSIIHFTTISQQDDTIKGDEADRKDSTFSNH